MAEPPSPFLLLLSHLSIGIKPNAFKKREKIHLPYPDGVYLRVYEGRLAPVLVCPSTAC